ncbi:MAG: hypothetical protein HOW73_47585 [Polyangiaceae bacterium]|nr:hypothetical protein [Polyangiaceae bacterium]
MRMFRILVDPQTHPNGIPDFSGQVLGPDFPMKGQPNPTVNRRIKPGEVVEVRECPEWRDEIAKGVVLAADEATAKRVAHLRGEKFCAKRGVKFNAARVAEITKGAASPPDPPQTQSNAGDGKKKGSDS